jgi:hypothetical protein
MTHWWVHLSWSHAGFVLCCVVLTIYVLAISWDEGNLK